MKIQISDDLGDNFELSDIDFSLSSSSSQLSSRPRSSSLKSGIEIIPKQNEKSPRRMPRNVFIFGNDERADSLEAPSDEARNESSASRIEHSLQCDRREVNTDSAAAEVHPNDKNHGISTALNVDDDDDGLNTTSFSLSDFLSLDEVTISDSAPSSGKRNEKNEIGTKLKGVRVPSDKEIFKTVFMYIWNVPALEKLKAEQEINDWRNTWPCRTKSLLKAFAQINNDRCNKGKK